MHKDVLAEYQESGELKKIIRHYSANSGFDRVIEYEDAGTVEVE